jgi:hypothetical protein
MKRLILILFLIGSCSIGVSKEIRNNNWKILNNLKKGDTIFAEGHLENGMIAMRKELYIISVDKDMIKVNNKWISKHGIAWQYVIRKK